MALVCMHLGCSSPPRPVPPELIDGYGPVPARPAPADAPSSASALRLEERLRPANRSAVVGDGTLEVTLAVGWEPTAYGTERNPIRARGLGDRAFVALSSELVQDFAFDTVAEYARVILALERGGDWLVDRVESKPRSSRINDHPALRFAVSGTTRRWQTRIECYKTFFRVGPRFAQVTCCGSPSVLVAMDRDCQAMTSTLRPVR